MKKLSSSDQRTAGLSEEGVRKERQCGLNYTVVLLEVSTCASLAVRVHGCASWGRYVGVNSSHSRFKFAVFCTCRLGYPEGAGGFTGVAIWEAVGPLAPQTQGELYCHGPIVPPWGIPGCRTSHVRNLEDDLQKSVWQTVREKQGAVPTDSLYAVSGRCQWRQQKLVSAFWGAISPVIAALGRPQPLNWSSSDPVSFFYEGTFRKK